MKSIYRIGVVLAMALFLGFLSMPMGAASTPAKAACQTEFNYGKLQSKDAQVSSADIGSKRLHHLYLKAHYQDAWLTFFIWEDGKSNSLFVYYDLPGGKFRSSPSVSIRGDLPGPVITQVSIEVHVNNWASYKPGQKGTEELLCKATNLFRQYYLELKVEQIFKAEGNPASYIR